MKRCVRTLIWGKAWEIPGADSLGEVDRLHITYGGKAQELRNIDPVTRAVLLGFLSRASVKDLNNVNVRSIASTLGLTVEEKRSAEPVTFNEWLHVQAFRNGEKVVSAGARSFVAREPADCS